jgi:SET domain-containing protein
VYNIVIEINKMNKDDFEKLKKIANRFYVCLKASPIEGVGVFAMRDIPKKTCPFYYESKFFRLTDEEYEQLPEYFKAYVKRYIVKQKGFYQIPLNPYEIFDYTAFLNHSDNPNIDEDFKAVRDIKSGEEITVDYRNIDEAWEEKMKI